MRDTLPIAPPLRISRWINTPEAPSLEALRGRVVALHAFQMLCPACVSHGLPQAARMHGLFEREGVAVIGLHTVFEHHAVMNAAALEAFVHEYRLGFPIGIDQADGEQPVPLTMRAYGLRGTPSLVLIDRAGRIRLSHFGRADDMALGASIGQLLSEGPGAGIDPGVSVGNAPPATAPGDCDAGACAAP